MRALVARLLMRAARVLDPRVPCPHGKVCPSAVEVRRLATLAHAEVYRIMVAADPVMALEACGDEGRLHQAIHDIFNV